MNENGKRSTKMAKGLVVLRPVPRSKVLSITTPAKLLEYSSSVFFFMVCLILSIIRWVIKKLKGIQNTAQRMMLIPYRRQMGVTVLVEKDPLKYLTTQLKKCRLNLWVSLHKRAIQSLNFYLKQYESKLKCRKPGDFRIQLQ